MKKIFTAIGIALATIIVLLLIFASTKPDVFRVERSTQINAAPESVVVHIIDFHKWQAWSPWEKLDPNMNRTFSGAESGTGAIYEWKGNSNVGSGRMEILEASPAMIKIKLDFLEPFEAHNTTEITLNNSDGITTITWAMFGKNNLLGKVMHIFFDMDKLVGKDFEIGLANLKKISEQ